MVLLHIDRASRSHQNLYVEWEVSVYMNRPYWIEFLDDNILQENIFIIISSLVMTVLARLCAITHTTIYLLTRWLAGNCHITSGYSWSVYYMERMVDDLEMALEYMKE